MSEKITYTEAVRILRDAGISSAPFEARLIISTVCGVPLASILGNPDKVYEDQALINAIKLRATRYPLQYILGDVGFRDCTFKVTEHTLIPRPDTELLVEYAVTHIPQNARIADLCTGSGCIAVSTLAERPDLCAVATDIDPDTLEVAAHNAQKNGVADRLTLLLDDVKHPDRISEYAPFDAILYECVSATATVGLSKNLTASLNFLGKLIIIATMYFGRVGPITLFIAFSKKKTRENIIKNPTEEVSVG